MKKTFFFEKIGVLNKNTDEEFTYIKKKSTKETN